MNLSSARRRAATSSVAVLLAVTLAACGGEPPSRATPSTTTPSAVASPSAAPAGRPSGANGTPLRASAATALDEARVRELLAVFADPDAEPRALRAALDEVVARGDLRFVAVLIELIDAGSVGRAAWDTSVVEALEDLTGQRFGRAWEQWVAWYGKTELEPPPGFLAWKARTLRPIDERFEEFFPDGAPHTIRIEDIVWGGVTVDGIVPLDNPPTVAAAEATYLAPDEPVFGLVVNGEARAYPLRIMDAHELANDVVGGRPISLVYCTLCGTGIAYDTTLADGTVLTFSTSGLLHQSNKLMYDRTTKSLWQQFSGRPVVGPLVAAPGTPSLRLRPLPMVLTRWSEWQRAHPDTSVLALETGRGRGYTLGYPYLEYFASGDPIFPLAARSTLQPAKAWVYGISVGEVDRAYPLRDLARNVVTNDEIGGVELVLVAPEAIIDVEAQAAVVGILSYEAGAAVRAFERPPGVRFAAGDASDVLVDESGGRWTVTEEALVGPSGESLPRVVGTLSFWFGWFSFHPLTELYEG